MSIGIGIGCMAWGGSLALAYLISMRQAAHAALHSQRPTFLRLRTVLVCVGVVVVPAQLQFPPSAVVITLSSFVTVRSIVLYREVARSAS